MENLVLQGRVALVTGGSGGIGSAVVRSLLAAGATVVSASSASDAAPDPNAGSERCHARGFEIRDEASVVGIFEGIDRELGRLDLLVHCAGIGVFRPIEELSVDEWRQVLETNLTGAFVCTREAMRRMRKQGGGRIVHLGSVADHQALPAQGAYGASKAGLRSLVQVANEEGKGAGIHATLLSLGAVRTPIWQGREGFDPREMLSPDDVARTLLLVATAPPGVRYDEIRMYPPKGTL